MRVFHVTPFDKETTQENTLPVKVGDQVIVRIMDDCFNPPREIVTAETGKIFEVKEKNGQLGIDWLRNVEPESYAKVWNNGDDFKPLTTFAPSVVFEIQE